MTASAQAVFRAFCAFSWLAACLPGAAADFVPAERTGAGIQKAVDEASAAGGGRVALEKGAVYRSGTIYLRSNVELHVPEGTVILGNDVPDGYDDVDDPRFGIDPEKSKKAFIVAIDAENVSITGKGTVDGQGVKFYDTGAMQLKGRFFRKPPHPRPRMLQLFGCRNVRFADVTFKDSPGWTCWARMCEDFTAERVTIRGDQRMINNDGFHIDSCRRVRIRRCSVKTGDDSIVMRAIRGRLGVMSVCEDVVVEDCELDSACQCIRLSCPSDGIVRNGTFRNLVMKGNNGVVSGHPARYLKSGTSAGNSMENILVENCDIDVFGRPMSFYVGPGIELKNFGNVTFRDIRVKAREPFQFKGTEIAPLRNIRLENVSGTVAAPTPLEVRFAENLVFDRFRVSGSR